MSPDTLPLAVAQDASPVSGIAFAVMGLFVVVAFLLFLIYAAGRGRSRRQESWPTHPTSWPARPKPQPQLRPRPQPLRAALLSGFPEEVSATRNRLEADFPGFQRLCSAVRPRWVATQEHWDSAERLLFTWCRLHLLAKRAMAERVDLAMPSPLADQLWHLLIEHDAKAWEHWTQRVVGMRIRHYANNERPVTEVMELATWMFACADAGVSPRQADQVPSLYAEKPQLAFQLARKVAGLGDQQPLPPRSSPAPAAQSSSGGFDPIITWWMLTNLHQPAEAAATSTSLPVEADDHRRHHDAPAVVPDAGGSHHHQGGHGHHGDGGASSGDSGSASSAGSSCGSGCGGGGGD